MLELDWSDTAALATLPRAHLLLAADVAYGMSEDFGKRGAEAAEVLANALAVLAAPRAVVLLAQLVRNAWQLRAYSKHSRAGLQLRPLHEETALHDALCRRFRVEQLPPSDGSRAADGLGIFRLHPLA